MWLWNFEVSMAALARLLFFYSHWNGLEVVIIDTGHHLTSHPMDVVLSESRDLVKNLPFLIYSRHWFRMSRFSRLVRKTGRSWVCKIRPFISPSKDFHLIYRWNNSIFEDYHALTFSTSISFIFVLVSYLEVESLNLFSSSSRSV